MLTAKSGYTLTGVADDFFTVSGTSTPATNSANSGVITAVFPDTEEVTYAIGDIGPSGVGIVFYVTDGGLHGLEVAPEDQSTWAAWSNIFDGFANGSTALPVGIGTGLANTTAIIAQTGHTDSAAQICRNYRADEEGDWFLPSKDELNAIWVNLVDNGSGANSGVGGFASDNYWSSSESTANHAWSQYFLDGNQTDDVKGSYGRVRAVRAF